MGYLFGITLFLVGYTLVDWGHYVVKGQRISMWYLISGQGKPEGEAPTATSSALGNMNPGGYTNPAIPGIPQPGTPGVRA